MLLSRIAPLIVAAGAIGCSPFDPDLAAQPFLCGASEPRCPDGYVCVAGSGSADVCALPEAGPDGGGDGGGLHCNADDVREPNNTPDSATMVPIPDAGDTATIDAVLCPETDIDVYRVTVDTTGKSIRIDVTYDSQRGPLAVDLLNSTGLVIRSATKVGNDPDHLRADFDNVASGVYYGRVQVMSSGFRADYHVTLVAANPLPP